MKRFALSLLALGLLAVAAMAALPLMVNGDFAAAQLSERMQQATGRKLTLLKPPHLKFWPELVLEAEGAGVSNPSGMFDGTLVSANKLRVRVSLYDLLARRFNVREVVLIEPRLTLVIDKQGKANWSFADTPSGTGNPASQSQDILSDASFAPVQISDGTLVFSDERTGTSFMASKINGTLKMQGPDTPADFDGHLEWNGQRADLQVFVKAPGRLASQGSPVDLGLQSRSLKAAYSGLARLNNGLNLAGTIDATSPDLRDLASWAGFKISGDKGLKNFSARAGLDLTGRVAQMKDAVLQLDDMNAQGTASLELGAERPLIKANIGIDQLNTNVYTGNTKDTESAAQQAGAGWSEEPIDLTGLDNLDASLKLRAGRVVHGGVILGETRLDIEIAEGKLSATLKKAEVYGGNGSGSVSIDADGTKATVTSKLMISDADARPLLQDAAGFSRFEGKLAVSLDLSGTGTSQADIISRLAGNARIDLSSGLVRGIDLSSMVKDVQASILGGWDKTSADGTRFDTVGAGFVFKDGIGRNDDLSIDGPEVKVSGAGEVDLLSRRLNYKVNPEVALSVGQFTAVAVPIVVQGPWAEPRIYPDVKGILEDPQAAFDTLSRLGVAIGKAGEPASEEKLVKETEKQLEKVLGKDGAQKAVESGGKLLNKLLQSGSE